MIVGITFSVITPVSAQTTTPLRVVIESVESLDGGIDFLNQADFYPIVTIGGVVFGGDVLTISNDDDPNPHWSFLRQVDTAPGTVIVTIQIWDNDSITGDDQIDITSGGGRQLDISVNLEPCFFGGGINGDCWVTETTAGTSNDNAEIRFRIEVGDAPSFAEVTLTIERVRDINDDADPLSNADFYPIVNIDGSEWGDDSYEITNDRDISPNWQFTKEVPITLGSISAFIIIMDDDGILADDQMDASPVNADIAMNLVIDLIPCSVSGDAGNRGCGVTIAINGDGDSVNGDNDPVLLEFRVDVVPPPAINGLVVRCMHEDLWPQNGDTVTVTAEALDNDLALLSNTNDVDIEIWVDSDAAPADTEFNVNIATHSFGVASGQFSYGCLVNADGSVVWSGWRSVQVDTSPTRAIPVIFTRTPSSAVDVIFIPDRDDYTGTTDPDFLDDVQQTILDSFYGELLFLSNQSTFNFWLAQDTADYEELCNFSEPANWDTSYAFAEAGSIVHTESLRDCARFSIRLFSGEVGDPRVFLHEAGHQPFGLADEYCCDGGYFETEPFTNLYESLTTCQADSINVYGEFGSCRSFIDEDGDQWFTSDPASNDLMIDNLTPQALDVRRIEWVLNACKSSSC